MSERQTYLLSIAIGPVQDFIAASRKARDLAFGSELLSKLSQAAATVLNNPPETKIIFPSPAALDERQSVANKLLAITSRDPRALADEAHDAVLEELVQQWQGLLGNARFDWAIRSIDIETGWRQIDEFVEWYAAWVPLNGEADYAGARSEVERLLGGRKALRDFWPASGVPERFKSSLDPSRESIVIPTAQHEEHVRRGLHLRRSEGLDAISLIKRLNAIDAAADGGEPADRSRFVSTSRVAVDPFIRAANSIPAVEPDLVALKGIARRLRKTEVVEEFNASLPGLDRYRHFPYDCQLFYELSAESAQRQVEAWNDPNYTAAARDFFNAVKRLKGDLKEQLGELPAYFAVLHADGDRMGKAIGALRTPEDHQDFSTELGKFAERAGEIVRKHYGALIYSGGDDVLAFLPLDTAIICAERLQKAFASMLEEALRDKEVDVLPTLSVGLAIGHYAEHLQVLLQRARDAEKAAKRPRNALAVSFSAHSGGGDDRVAVNSWADGVAIDHWATAIDFHRHDALPDGAAYELDGLRREFDRAKAEGVLDGFGDETAGNVLIDEALRILKRKRSGHGSDSVDKKIIARVEARLRGALDRSDSASASGADGRAGLKRVLDELEGFVNEVIIARRIARLLIDENLEAFALWNAEGVERLVPRDRKGASEPTEERVAS